MRTLLFYTVLLCGLATSLTHAQMDRGSVYIGAVGSYNTSFIANQNNYGQKEMDYDPAFTLSYGVQLGFPISDRLDIKTGVEFQDLGQKYEDNFSGANFKKEVDFSYIAIPLKFKYYFKKRDSDGDRSGGSMYGSFGAQFAFQTDASYSLQVNDQDAGFASFALVGGDNPHADIIGSLLTDPAVEDLYNTFDIQGYLGLGYHHFLSSNLTLEVEGRMIGSVTDFNKEEWRLDNREGEYRGSYNTMIGLQLGLNYMF